MYKTFLFIATKVKKKLSYFFRSWFCKLHQLCLWAYLYDFKPLLSPIFTAGKFWPCIYLNNATQTELLFATALGNRRQMECRTSAWTSGRHHIKCTQKLLSFNASKNVKELFLKFQPITVFLNLRKRAHKLVIWFSIPYLIFSLPSSFSYLTIKIAHEVCIIIGL